MIFPFAEASVTFDPATLGEVPAPFWFVQFFKVLGFVLHMLAMNLWFAGLPIVILVYLSGTKNGRRFAKRLFCQLPVIMALGINFGIVPLLFVQTVYYKMFYSATILMAWHWILVIPLVMIAYYSLYIAAFSVRKEKKSMQTLLAGLVSMVCLFAVAYIFVNAMSLMGRPDTWGVLWEKWQTIGDKDFGAATLGLGINSMDVTIWYRLGTMFGLALTTTAFWAVFDSQILIPKYKELDAEQLKIDNQYRRLASNFAVPISLLGGIIAAASFYQYVGCVKANPVTADLLTNGSISFYLIYLAVIAPFFPLLGLLATKILRFGPKLTATKIAGAQLVTLASYAVARQWVQNVEVSQVVPVAQLKENTTDVSPIIVFLVLFVIGAIVIAWMLRQIAILPPEKPLPE